MPNMQGSKSNHLTRTARRREALRNQLFCSEVHRFSLQFSSVEKVPLQTSFDYHGTSEEERSMELCLSQTRHLSGSTVPPDKPRRQRSPHTGFSLLDRTSPL